MKHNNISNHTVGKRLSSVKNMPSHYPEFTPGSIRWLIFNGQENGFEHCTVRIGRKILIDLDKFDLWLDEQAYKGGC